MFKYSEKTEVNITFKMLELFRTIKADKDVKTDAKNITAVKLINTLSPERVNLEPCEMVKEIYIMDIELNSDTIPTKFIDAMNRYINFQILFRLKYNNKTKYIVAPKEFLENKVKVIKTFESNWQIEEQQEFPITTKLENVLKFMIAYITKYNFHNDEDFENYADRLQQIKKLQTEIEKLTKSMNAEKQPNLKMEMNNQIKELKRKLMTICN